MSATRALATLMAAWLAIGVMTGIIMGRRGQDSFTWWLLGTVLGPLVIPLAMSPGGRGGGGTRRPVPGTPPDGSFNQARPARRQPAATGRRDRRPGILPAPVPTGTLAARPAMLPARQEADWRPT